MKVEQFYAINQFHLYGNGLHELQSYNSLVVEINNRVGTIILGRDWDYSTTTSKYVYMFLEKYGNINFDGITNKKKYVNRLIEEHKISYNDSMF